MSPSRSHNSSKKIRPSQRFYGEKQLFGMRGWSWFSMGNVGWWIQDAWFSRIVGPHGLKWKDWEAAGQLTIIKDGPLRTVYRVSLEDSGIYIKHYRVPWIRGKIRQWLRRGKARNEGDKALKLASTGITTVEPIALGEERRLGLVFDNYLVTKEIPGVEPLDHFLEKTLPGYTEARIRSIRRRIGEELARLCARLHEKGFLHQDFHPGNLLICLDANDQPSLFLIDLDALDSHPDQLRISEIRDNLAQINNYFWSRASRAERLRFLELYLKFRKRHNPLAPEKLSSFSREIEAATRRWAERLWRRWARRNQGTNKYYKVVTAPATWAVLSRKLEREHFHEIAADPDRLIYAPDARILKHSQSSTVAEVTIRTRHGDQRVIIKKIPTLKASDFWFGWLKSHRSWRAWKAAGHMVARSVPTPEPLAYISRGSPGVWSLMAWFYPTATYTISQRPEGMKSLSQHMEGYMAQMSSMDRILAVRTSVVPMARMIRQMHEMSLSHRDLKAANILVRPLEDGSWREMMLVDLVGVRLRHPLPHDARVKNLARIAMSFHAHGLFQSTNALRFLFSYLPIAYLPRDAWKEFWRDVQREVNVKLNRNQKNGRPIS
jgi:serine/threonine protein kinase